MALVDIDTVKSDYIAAVRKLVQKAKGQIDFDTTGENLVMVQIIDAESSEFFSIGVEGVRIDDGDLEVLGVNLTSGDEDLTIPIEEFIVEAIVSLYERIIQKPEAA